MNKSLFRYLPLFALNFALYLPSSAHADKASTVDPYALSIIQSASNYLGSAKNVQFVAEICEDAAIEDGPILQIARTVTVSLTRPAGLRLEVAAPEPTRTFTHNGKALTIYDVRTGFYGSIDAAPSLDETISNADEIGIHFPIEDLLVSKPFGDGASKADSGQYLGLVNVLGTECHHLAFQSKSIEWQAWVQTGPKPLLRKVAVTFKDEDDARLTAHISNWDLDTAIPASAFTFTPPPNSTKIEVLPAEEGKTKEAK